MYKKLFLVLSLGALDRTVEANVFSAFKRLFNKKTTKSALRPLGASAPKVENVQQKRAQSGSSINFRGRSRVKLPQNQHAVVLQSMLKSGKEGLTFLKKIDWRRHRTAMSMLEVENQRRLALERRKKIDAYDKNVDAYNQLFKAGVIRAQREMEYHHQNDFQDIVNEICTNDVEKEALQNFLTVAYSQVGTREDELDASYGVVDPVMIINGNLMYLVFYERNNDSSRWLNILSRGALFNQNDEYFSNLDYSLALERLERQYAYHFKPNYDDLDFYEDNIKPAA